MLNQSVLALRILRRIACLRLELGPDEVGDEVKIQLMPNCGDEVGELVEQMR